MRALEAQVLVVGAGPVGLVAAIDLKTLLPPGLARRMGVRRLVAIPRTTQADWDFVARKMAGA